MMDTCDASRSDQGIAELVCFSKKYPQLLEPLLERSLPIAQQKLSSIGFTYTMDRYNKLITLSTTMKEPAVHRRADEFLQLLAVNVGVQLAFTVFTEGVSYCIIKIWRPNLGINKEEFRKQKNLFWDSRKALEQLTSCKISIRFATIVVTGKSEGVKIVRKMAEDCFFSNESPAPKIRKAKRELKWELKREER